MDGPSVSLGSKLSDAKVSFAIFKRDIKRLLVNPVALVVTLGVCVIPSLYAWYNIVANWDPYGNTQGIKIAIANNDQGTQNDLVGELNAGDKVVDQLKENDQLGWTFVDSAADAKEGVESGEYYAAIVIPKNFSDNLVSMLDGNYHQPKLTYYVNEKKSAIAPKVTDTGANTIEEQINAEFVSTVGETVGCTLQAEIRSPRSGNRSARRRAGCSDLPGCRTGRPRRSAPPDGGIRSGPR